MENKLTPEIIEKAKQAKSVEELLSLAKENEIELTEDEGKAYFEQLHKSGELSDEELGNVAGGGCDICTRISRRLEKPRYCPMCGGKLIHRNNVYYCDKCDVVYE